MPIYHFPQKAEKFEIQTYEKPRNASELKENHVAFTGALFKHPSDRDRAVLLAEPYGSQTLYYEFQITDIFHMEDVANVTNLEGEVITITKIWVKKGTLGVRCLPFLVEEIRAI